MNQAAGIVSTHSEVLHASAKLGLITVQRTFALDSAAVEAGLRATNHFLPDAVEILPAVAAPRVAKRFREVHPGLRIVAARMLHLTTAQAEAFYEVHRERPFYGDLVRYMSSGPVIAQVLEGENAIARNRDIMGATDPKRAATGTIRADLAESIEANVVHGSDAFDTASREISFFFSGTDLCPRN